MPIWYAYEPGAEVDLAISCRLIAKGAHTWVDERRDQVVHQAASLRREASTQELLELVATARAAHVDEREGRGPWVRRR